MTKSETQLTLHELNPIDGFLLEMLGEYHRHLCSSCDGADIGCINCRHTGYDQTPCLICDKDGVAFKNRREFLDKVKTHFQQALTSLKSEMVGLACDKCRVRMEDGLRKGNR